MYTVTDISVTYRSITDVCEGRLSIYIVCLKIYEYVMSVWSITTYTNYKYEVYFLGVMIITPLHTVNLESSTKV